MPAMTVPAVGLVVSERDQGMVEDLDRELRAQGCALCAVVLPTPPGELGYVQMAADAIGQVAAAFADTKLRGLLFASSAAETVLGVEATSDLCAELSHAAADAPTTSLLALLKSELRQAGLHSPMLLCDHGWPITLMIRSELLREGLTITKSVCLDPGVDMTGVRPSSDDLAQAVLENIVAGADGVVLIGERLHWLGASSRLVPIIDVPLLSSTALLLRQALQYVHTAEQSNVLGACGEGP